MIVGDSEYPLQVENPQRKSPSNIDEIFLTESAMSGIQFVRLVNVHFTNGLIGSSFTIGGSKKRAQQPHLLCTYVARQKFMQ